MRKELKKAKKIVIKIGSSLLINDKQQLNTTYINHLCEQIAACKITGKEIVIVSSGSVAAGVSCLKQKGRPNDRTCLQVAAAVGQMRLINAYENAFSRHNLHAAQVLLTAEEMANRTIYLNARATLRHFLKYSIIPVINENDVISTDAVCFENNDYLAAQISNLLEADLLLLLTNVNGIYKDKSTPDCIVGDTSANDSTLLTYVDSSKSDCGLGGMQSKIYAARMAARSGAHTLIINGEVKNCIESALTGDKDIGSFLRADIPRLSARKQWLASGLLTRGKVILDDGAVNAIVIKKRSLLTAGIQSIEGNFARGDAIKIMSRQGNVIGHALINYNSNDAKQLCGVKSKDIASILGYAHEEEMVHRDNMSILQ